MRFTIDAKDLFNGIKKAQLKGKYFTSSGLKNGVLGEYLVLEIVDNITLYNADTTLCLSVDVIPTTVDIPGSCIIEATKALNYLYNFSGDIVVEVTDLFRITGDGKTASMPVVISHPNSDLITRFKNRVGDLVFEATPETMPRFTGTRYKTWIQTSSNEFIEAIKSCEVVKTGVYKLDFDGQECIISSGNHIEKLTNTVNLTNCNTEPATVEYTGPLHILFEGPINIFFNDNSPLLIVGAGCKVIKAPFLVVN